MKCEVCGGLPAEPILLQSASSRILWWSHRKVDATLCGFCAEDVFYHQQSRSLIQGWWGPLSALATILFSITNYFRITKHRKLVTTVEVNGVESIRPRLKVTRNPAAMIVSAIAIFIILSLATAAISAPDPVSESNPASFNLTCWEDLGSDNLNQVSCDSSDADFETYQVVEDPSFCLDSYINAGEEFACLREKY